MSCGRFVGVLSVRVSSASVAARDVTPLFPVFSEVSTRFAHLKFDGMLTKPASSGWGSVQLRREVWNVACGAVSFLGDQRKVLLFQDCKVISVKPV